ncbi:OmpP1/FadL family transporter [Pseudodesulfovibrio sp.]|uniref:OmpP1/FadL family transporter n=1 Tax=unclassified Pseudodesulfovibrio TaxID=2661612 RepID=UPI003B008802
MLVSSVHAGGFALYEWSNRGLAMGTTGYAQGVDASVIATNPSLMTKLPGKSTLVGATVISPQSTVDVNGNKNKTKANLFVVPHAYYSQQMADNDKVWLGVGMFTRYGLGTEYDDNWIGRGSLQYVDLESTSVTPTMAFKLSDDFSMAIGLEVLRGSIALKKTINQGFGDKVISADTVGYAVGGNLSMNYDITDDISMGFVWRAPMKIHTSGSGQNDLASAYTDTNQDIEATLPGSYALGVAYKPTDKWTFEFDVVHTRWESLDAMHYSGVIDSKEDFYYKNTWRFQFGAEYWATDWLALRAGYVYDQTPTRATHASFMLPANDRRLFSGGLGFKWDNWTADLSTMYITTKERYGVPIQNPNNGSYFNVNFNNGTTWASGLSIGYTF